jgi:hypothetical protein
VVQHIVRIAYAARGQKALWTARCDHFGGRLEWIEALHMQEALAAARRRFPAFAVMREDSDMLCDEAGGH